MYVKYKLLSPHDAELIRQSLEDLPRKEYIQEIIGRVIYNSYTDILPELRSRDKKMAASIVSSLYMGSIMLNPALDIDAWTSAAHNTNVLDMGNDLIEQPSLFQILEDADEEEEELSPSVIKKIPRARILSLEDTLKEKVKALEKVSKTKKKE